MNHYRAFYESVPETDSDPVRFHFTEEEVEQFDIVVGERLHSFTEERIVNLSEREYAFLRAALIFEVMGERLK